MRVLRGAFAGLLAVLSVLAGLAVLGVLVPRAPHAVSANRAGSHAVFLAANPIHTDLVLPSTPELLARLAFLAQDGLPLDHPNLRAVAVGWGGRAFYTQTPHWADLGFDAVWRSLSLDRSVLHVALAGAVGEEGPDLRRVELGEDAYQALLDFVEASFEPGADGRPQAVPNASYGAFDRFYEARGSFNALLGCNTWTAAALRAGGLTTGFWTPLPRSLFWSLDLHGAP